MKKVLLSLEDLSKVNGGHLFDYVGKYGAIGYLIYSSDYEDSVFISKQMYEKYVNRAKKELVPENMIDSSVFDMVINSDMMPFTLYKTVKSFKRLNKPWRVYCGRYH